MNDDNDKKSTVEQIDAVFEKCLKIEKNRYKNQLFDRGVIDDMIEEVKACSSLTDDNFMLNLDAQLEKLVDSGNVLIMGYDKFSEETKEHLFKIKCFRAKKIESRWMFQET